MKRKQLLFAKIFGLFLFAPFYAAAQDVQPNATVGQHLSISVQPLFLFTNALKMDVEWQRPLKKLAFIGGAEFYNGPVSPIFRTEQKYGDQTEDRINGFGITAALKYKFRADKISSFYFSPGITYRRLNLKLTGPAYYSYLENDIEYYSYGNVVQEHQLHPVIIYGNIGVQHVEKSGLLADVYVGIAYKTVNRIHRVEVDRDYEKRSYGYNYRGLLFQAGVKLGFQLK